MRKGLSGGKRYGPPPERGPNPQGIKIVDKGSKNKNIYKKRKLRLLICMVMSVHFICGKNGILKV